MFFLIIPFQDNMWLVVIESRISELITTLADMADLATAAGVAHLVWCRRGNMAVMLTWMVTCGCVGCCSKNVSLVDVTIGMSLLSWLTC